MMRVFPANEGESMKSYFNRLARALEKDSIRNKEGLE